jgi:hypothetical protein
MATRFVDSKIVTWLDDHAQEWVEAGLISTDEAAAIRHHEHLDEPVVAPRLTIVAEIACYLGSVIAFAGGAAIIGPNWEALRFGGQLAVAFAIAIMGFAVGTWLIHLREAGTERLGSFLWVIGTGGAAMVAAVVTNKVDPTADAWFSVVIGLMVAVLGVVLWRNLDRPLQLLTAAGGSFFAYAGVVELTDASAWLAAPVLQLAALALGACAAVGLVHPRLVALMTAAAALMVGAFLYSEGSERFSATAAVVSAAAIVMFALHDRSWPLVALGLVAFFIGTMAMMSAVLHGIVARLIAVLLGLAVVGYVAVRAQRTGHEAPPTNDN